MESIQILAKAIALDELRIIKGKDALIWILFKQLGFFTTN